MSREHHEDRISLRGLSSVNRVVLSILFLVIIVLGIAGCVPICKYTPIVPLSDSRYRVNGKTVHFSSEDIHVKIKGEFMSPGRGHLFYDFSITIQNDKGDTMYIPSDGIQITYFGNKTGVEPDTGSQYIYKYGESVWWIPPYVERTRTISDEVRREWVNSMRLRHVCLLEIRMIRSSYPDQPIEFRVHFKY